MRNSEPFTVLWRVLAVILSGALAAEALLGAEADVRRDATVDVVERVMPSVVNIATETIVEYNDPFEQMLREFWGPYYRHRPPNTQYSLGSGVIVDENGYVLTNLHVVRRAGKTRVRLADGREFDARPIVGNTRKDVALLKLVAAGNDRFKAVKFAQFFSRPGVDPSFVRHIRGELNDSEALRNKEEERCQNPESK